jgi:serine/threonine protein kinase
MASQAISVSDQDVIQSRWFEIDRSVDLRTSLLWMKLRLKDSCVPLAQLGSPWIGCPELVQVHEVLPEEPAVLIIESFQGLSLACLLDRQISDVERAFAILRQIAIALDHLHRHNLAHGALTPRSILVGEGPALRIIDWMIDWNRVPLRSLAEDCEYIAPERLSGAASGPQGDQFALGAIAHRLLTGHSAFPAAGLAERLFCIRYEVLDEAAFGATGFAAQAIYERVFSVDPTQRFDSCCAFVDELQRASQNRVYGQTRFVDFESEEDGFQPESRTDESSAEQIQLRTKSLSRWFAAAAAFALFAFLAGLANWGMERRLETLQRSERSVADTESMGSLQNGVFEVCNNSASALEVRELAAAYWDREHALRVFNSTTYAPEGWAVAPASSRRLSWTPASKPVWDGSVLLYFVQVRDGQKEYLVSGRWDGSVQGCLHLTAGM